MSKPTKPVLKCKTFRDVDDAVHRKFIIQCMTKGVSAGKAITEAMQDWLNKHTK